MESPQALFVRRLGHPQEGGNEKTTILEAPAGAPHAVSRMLCATNLGRWRNSPKRGGADGLEVLSIQGRPTALPVRRQKFGVSWRVSVARAISVAFEDEAAMLGARRFRMRSWTRPVLLESH